MCIVRPTYNACCVHELAPKQSSLKGTEGRTPRSLNMQKNEGHLQLTACSRGEDNYITRVPRSCTIALTGLEQTMLGQSVAAEGLVERLRAMQLPLCQCTDGSGEAQE
jgi:hypothetical protein